MRRSQWLTHRRILSNWITDDQSEAERKVSLSRQTETFSTSPLLLGEGPLGIGLDCFGEYLLNLSNANIEPESEELRVLAHPLLLENDLEEIGEDVFGFELEGVSSVPKSAFIDVNQVRAHWLEEKNTLSNWVTPRMNEEQIMVSLSEQVLSFSQSPLLFNGFQVLGLLPFGGGLVNVSTLVNSLGELDEDLFDTLATEDFDPIVTEDDMDEIALG